MLISADYVLALIFEASGGHLIAHPATRDFLHALGPHVAPASPCYRARVTSRQAAFSYKKLVKLVHIYNPIHVIPLPARASIILAHKCLELRRWVSRAPAHFVAGLPDLSCSTLGRCRLPGVASPLGAHRSPVVCIVLGVAPRCHFVFQSMLRLGASKCASSPARASS